MRVGCFVGLVVVGGGRRVLFRWPFLVPAIVGGSILY